MGPPLNPALGLAAKSWTCSVSKFSVADGLDLLCVHFTPQTRTRQDSLVLSVSAVWNRHKTAFWHTLWKCLYFLHRKKLNRTSPHRENFAGKVSFVGGGKAAFNKSLYSWIRSWLLKPMN